MLYTDTRHLKPKLIIGVRAALTGVTFSELSLRKSIGACNLLFPVYPGSKC